MLKCQDPQYKPPEELVESGLGIPAALNLLQAVVPKTHRTLELSLPHAPVRRCMPDALDTSECYVGGEEEYGGQEIALW